MAVAAAEPPQLASVAGSCIRPKAVGGSARSRRSAVFKADRVVLARCVQKPRGQSARPLLFAPFPLLPLAPSGRSLTSGLSDRRAWVWTRSCLPVSAFVGSTRAPAGARAACARPRKSRSGREQIANSGLSWSLGCANAVANSAVRARPTAGRGGATGKPLSRVGCV